MDFDAAIKYARENYEDYPFHNSIFIQDSEIQKILKDLKQNNPKEIEYVVLTYDGYSDEGLRFYQNNFTIQEIIDDKPNISRSFNPKDGSWTTIKDSSVKEIHSVSSGMKIYPEIKIEIKTNLDEETSYSENTSFEYYEDSEEMKETIKYLDEVFSELKSS